MASLAPPSSTLSQAPLHINNDNAMAGNRAVASVLLLYYHLLREGGITNDQTVYVNADDFDPFCYLCVEVEGNLSDIDANLLRQGAVVHLLCDLQDMIDNDEHHYLNHPLVQRILAAAAAGHLAAIPEAAAIVSMVSAGISGFSFATLQAQLAQVYERYVLGRMRSLVE